MRRLQARILLNEEVAEGFYRMRVESLYLARKIKPGQFVEVRCSQHTDPFLRRPLGCHRILKNGIEILYEIVGRGTELLSHKRPGEALDIIGPLGNGFDIKRTTPNHSLRSGCAPYRMVRGSGQASDERRATILVAGGIGVAPLFALAEELAQSSSLGFARDKKLKAQRKNLYVLIGAKTKSHILCEDDFCKLGAHVLIVTEDGSKGRRGLVTDILKTLRTTNDERRTTIYACGPVGMLKAVARIAETERIPCQVSLEERMACGVGVCLGCPVRVRESKPANRQTGKPANYIYKMVCKDGPVFNAEDVAWGEIGGHNTYFPEISCKEIGIVSPDFH